MLLLGTRGDLLHSSSNASKKNSKLSAVEHPTAQSAHPSGAPMSAPTAVPTAAPTGVPSHLPTASPTTLAPTIARSSGEIAVNEVMSGIRTTEHTTSSRWKGGSDFNHNQDLSFVSTGLNNADDTLERSRAMHDVMAAIKLHQSQLASRPADDAAAYRHAKDVQYVVDGIEQVAAGATR